MQSTLGGGCPAARAGRLRWECLHVTCGATRAEKGIVISGSKPACCRDLSHRSYLPVGVETHERFADVATTQHAEEGLDRVIDAVGHCL